MRDYAWKLAHERTVAVVDLAPPEAALRLERERMEKKRQSASAVTVQQPVGEDGEAADAEVEDGQAAVLMARELLGMKRHRQSANEVAVQQRLSSQEVVSEE